MNSDIPKELTCQKCNKPTVSQYLSMDKKTWLCWECSKEEEGNND